MVSEGAPFAKGDLVECIAIDATPGSVFVFARPGDHFHAAMMIPPDDVETLDGLGPPGWAFLAVGDDPATLPTIGCHIAVRECALYRRIEPKGQQFFAGDIEASVWPPEGVPARQPEQVPA